MEGEHADGDCRPDTTRTTLDPEPIAILPHFLHLHYNISGARGRIRDVAPVRGVAGFLLYGMHRVELLDKCGLALPRGMKSILLLEFGNDISA